MATEEPAKLLARGQEILSAHPRAVQAAGLLVALLVLSIQFGRMISAPIDEVDEAAVYDSTSYLGLWCEGQLFDPAWQSLDAVDHPPLWKYAHGAALLLAAQPLGSLAEKERWFDWAWDGDDDGAFKRHLNARLVGPLIRPGRWLSFLAVSGALILLSGLLARAYSPAISGWVVALIGFHVVTKWVAVRALIDGLLLLLILLSTALCARWLARGPARGRVSAPDALLLGLSLGLLAETKITGVIGLLGAAGALLLWWWRGAPSGIRLRPALSSLALVAVVTGVVAIAVNPSLWVDPFGFPLRMAAHRAEQLRLQMALFDERVYVSMGEGLRRFVSRALIHTDPVLKISGLPVVAFLVALGAQLIVRIERPLSAARAALLAQLGLWFGVTVLTYRMDWARYTIPAIPLLTLALVLGARALAAPRKLLGPAALAAALAASVVLFAREPLPESAEARRAHYAAGLELIDRQLSTVPAGSHKRRALELARERILLRRSAL